MVDQNKGLGACLRALADLEGRFLSPKAPGPGPHDRDWHLRQAKELREQFVAQRKEIESGMEGGEPDSSLRDRAFYHQFVAVEMGGGTGGEDLRAWMRMEAIHQFMSSVCYAQGKSLPDDTGSAAERVVVNGEAIDEFRRLMFYPVLQAVVRGVPFYVYYLISAFSAAEQPPLLMFPMGFLGICDNDTIHETNERAEDVLGRVALEFEYRRTTLGKNDGLMFGMPPQAALEIGLAFLMGRDLPPDRQRARDYIAYAALVGNPRAMMIYLLCFMGLRDGDGGYRVAFDFMKAACALALYLDDEDYEECRRIMGGDAGVDRELAVSLLSALINFMAMVATQERDDGIVSGITPCDWAVEQALDLLRCGDYPGLRAALCSLAAVDGPGITDYRFYDRVLNAAREIVSAGKPGKADPGDLKIFEAFLGNGLRSGHEQSVVAMADLEILLDGQFARSPYVERAAALGHAGISFRLGSAFWNGSDGVKGDVAQARRWWGRSSHDGFPLAMFNEAISCISEGNFAQGARIAGRAVADGLKYGYFVMSHAEIGQVELSHSHLYLSAQSHFSPALREVQELRSRGKFHPLRCIDLIDRLDALSASSATAALFMADASGVLYPHDELRANSYLLSGARMGDRDAVYRLSVIYSRQRGLSMGCDSGYAMAQSMAGMASYYSNRKLEQDPKEKEARALIAELYAALSSGKTDIERGMLIRAVDRQLFSPHVKSIPSAIELLQRDGADSPYICGDLVDFLASEYVPPAAHGEQRLRRLRVELEWLEVESNTGHVSFDEFMMLLALRPLGHVLVPELVRRHALRARSAGSSLAGLVMCFDLGMLLGQGEEPPQPRALPQVGNMDDPTLFSAEERQ
ncbi:MAG: hypothetical protein K6A65_09315 [Succinivibrionaceae bacterium]|nr:hypothetical protein [Succinivibrionaceae bacterium]